LSRIEDIWPWLEESVFPVVYPSVRYNGDPMDLEERQYIYNMDGYLMGPLRMKQNRDEDGKQEFLLLIPNANMKF